MKVSKARLDEALELRDAALRILGRTGLDTIFADRNRRHHTRQIEMNGLTIMHSRPARQQLLDIWQARKVFSVAWDATETLTVVAFRPGDWQDILRANAGAQVN
jgi:hypothetical protein